MNWSSEKNESYSVCEFQENLDIMRQIHHFAGFPLETLKLLAYMCVRETFKPGDYLFRQGEDDGQAFYVIDGVVRLEHTDDNRTEFIQDYEAGNFIGVMSLLSNLNRLFSLKAHTQVECLVFQRDKFLSTMAQFPDLMPKMIKNVATSIFEWEERFLKSRGVGCDACRHKVGVSLV